MNEPLNTPEGAFFGVKFAVLLAGFMGSVVSLSFVRGLTKKQILLAVLVGVACANYVTPIAMHYLGLPREIELGAAFFVGLTAMNFIPAVLKLSEASTLVDLIKGRINKGDTP